MKLYSEKSSFKEQPTNKTIQYILNYSKQFRVIKTNKNFIELHLN